jgi:outer membrane protein
MATKTTRLTVLLALLSTSFLAAQSASQLPDAPQNAVGTMAQSAASTQSTQAQNAPVPGQSPSLTLRQAEALAIKNNPQISSARLQALAAQQVVREVRSNYWPTAVGNLTAVDSKDNSRITAGALNNPIIYERGAGGVNVSQQITDFGRTANLVSSAGLNAKAQEQSSLATRQQILLATDQSFYNVLQARAVLRVAEQTVTNRQDVVDQVQALTKSNLKSDLDLSFAQVNFAQARLLRLDAENNEKVAQATLAAILGYSNAQEFDPVEETGALDAPPTDLDTLVQQGIDSRPELRSADYQYQAAEKFMHAERDAFLPTLSAQASVGGTPFRDQTLGPWYGAAGVNLQIPIFNGFLFSARAKEADLRAQSVQQRRVDLRNSVARDIRASWLNAKTAYDRLDVTNQLLKQANLALDLSQTRYKLGLGSIVELSQAQLQQTQADISQAQASYEYRLALDVLRYHTTGL